MEKDPERRYPSPQVLAEDLERWPRREPITARPVSRLERAVKWVKRKPAVAALGSATVLAILLGMAGIALQ